MLNQDDINAETINSGRFFLFLILFVLSGVYICLAIAVNLQIPLIGIVGAICFALPLFFQERLSKIFIKQVKLTFHDEYFSLTLSNIQGETEISTEDFSYHDITSCMISSTQSKYSYSRIKITFSNNQDFEYALRSPEKATAFNVSEAIYKDIRLRKKDITLIPAFFASKKAQIL